MSHGVRAGLALLAFALALPARPAAAQTRTAVGCELCHGELELLRAQTGSLEAAERLFATSAQVRGSAHTGMDCAECHSGFGRYPHASRAATRGCGSCHEQAAALWQAGVHADSTSSEPTRCSACHDVHDVMGAEARGTDAGAGRLNAHCTECHESSHLPTTNPHYQTVLCTSCHAPHDTKHVDDPTARVAPANQFGTCRACHGEETAQWPSDAHGSALLEPARRAAGAEVGHPPPACTSCHGAHDMLEQSDPEFKQAVLERCSECHEHEAESYLETYHGQASALGSKIVATCSACHGSHDILPAADAASAIAPANRIDTCGRCHPQARASFVEYDSHPDPGDRDRSAILYWVFLFMNVLLVSVFSVFGVHTLLWWARLVGGRRQNGAESGGHHG
jgi:hypothetical protein